MTRPRVRWLAPFAQKTGYAQATHDYLMALHRHGKVDLDVVPIVDADSDDLDVFYRELLPLVGDLNKAGPNWPTHIVVHTPPKFAPEFVTGDMTLRPGVAKICLTTWECDRLLERDADRLGVFHKVIVPSQHNADAFSDVPSEIEVIPHTYDPNFWHLPIPKKLAARKSYGIRVNEEVSSVGRRYVFYSIGAWAERKNPIGLLKAYLAEFRESDPVELLMHSTHINRDDFKALVQAMGIQDPPRVLLSEHHYSMEEVRDFIHQSSDCYVSATRGEGWGLGMFEAALVGNPVIATGWSGHLDFLCEPSVAKDLVPFQLTPAVSPEAKVSEINIAGMKISGIAPNVPSGIRGDLYWAEPDLKYLRQALRSAFNRRWSGSAKAEWFFKSNFSYFVVGKIFGDMLRNISL